MNFDIVANLITIIGLTTPILLAGLGELVVEKSGVLNLGVEGMMLIGAISGFGVTVMTGNPWAGLMGAAVGGALSSLLFGVLIGGVGRLIGLVGCVIGGHGKMLMVESDGIITQHSSRIWRDFH